MRCLHQFAIICLSVGLLATMPANLRATTITVTSTADSGGGTLRSAVASAANGDTIDFALTTPATITLTSGELLVTKNVTITGPGAAGVAVSGNHASRVFHIVSNNVVTIAGLTITSGYEFGTFSTGTGGGIYNDHATLTVSNCTLSGNSARFGGGIHNNGQFAGSATLNIVNSTLFGNRALDFAAGGGGLYNDGSGGSANTLVLNSTLRDNSSYYTGGAIRNFASGGSARMNILNSTLSGNSALNAAGAVANDSFQGGTVRLEIGNCTLSGNSAGGGGAIYNSASSGAVASSRIQNSTLGGNQASSSSGGILGGGIYNAGAGASVEIGSTILKNTASPGAFGGNIFNFNSLGAISSLGFNLSSDDANGYFSATGDQIDTDPMLGPLQDNGGPTFTHALLLGSPAIDKGENFSGSATDQRGLPRTFDKAAIANAAGGDGTDIGAVESQSLTVINTSNDGVGSLRQTIFDANTDPGISIIDFAPSAYGTILLTSGELLITKNLSIVGPGATNLAVDGNASSRVFRTGTNTVVVISSLTITNGRSSDRGGGIRNDHATLTLRDCIVAGNSTDYAGGGIFSDGEFVGSASLIVSNCILSGNSSSSHGGGIFNNGYYGNASVQVADCTFDRNWVYYGGGGGIWNGGVGGTGTLQVVRSTLTANTVQYAGASGGGIFNDGYNGNVTLQIKETTLAGNSAGYAGGGIYNNGVEGGSASLSVSNCTLNGNLAESVGGIYNDGTRGSASLIAVNVTLSGNHSINGGAIFNSSYTGNGSVQLLNSTLRGNASYYGGANILNLYGSVNIGSTLLNPPSYSGSDGSVVSFNGNFISLGYNLSSDDAGGFLTNATDQINPDPKLGPLQDNGGPTFTHAFTCRSPAIDHGKNFSGSASDQRGPGFTRTFDDPAVVKPIGGDGSDIGAFEAQQPLPVCDNPPVADASATVALIISPNGTNATVILDGSRSSDPDGDSLQYTWFESGNPLASGVVAVTVLPVGTHTISLVVNDGLLTATNDITIEIITAAEAVNRLAIALSSSAGNIQSLAASLKAALASIDRSNPTAAINQLLAFQNQVHVQIEALDSALAASLIQAAQEIIDSLSSGNTNPGGHPDGKFTSVTRQSNGHTWMQFSAEGPGTYIIEASTNLVNWEMIGIAGSTTDTLFEFDDAQSTRFSTRFYRVVRP